MTFDFYKKKKKPQLVDSGRPSFSVGDVALGPDSNLKLDNGFAKDILSDIRRELHGFPLLQKCGQNGGAIHTEMVKSGLPLRFVDGDDEIHIDYAAASIPREKDLTFEDSHVHIQVKLVTKLPLTERLHNAEVGIKQAATLLARTQNYGGACWVARIYWGKDRSKNGKTLDCYGNLHRGSTGDG